jgi:hypothetical protein
MARSERRFTGHLDGLPGWWVRVRVWWAEVGNVAGLARSVPSETKRDAREHRLLSGSAQGRVLWS